VQLIGPTGPIAAAELLLDALTELLDIAELLDLTVELLDSLAELLDIVELLDLTVELLDLTVELLDSLAELLDLTALLLLDTATTVSELLDITELLLLDSSGSCGGGGGGGGLLSELELLKTCPCPCSSGSEPELQAKNENVAITTEKSNIFGKYVRIFIPPEWFIPNNIENAYLPVCQLLIFYNKLNPAVFGFAFVCAVVCYWL